MTRRYYRACLSFLRIARPDVLHVFTPDARCVHVGGAAHGGRHFRENVGGHLRYLSLHGRPGEAERARRLLRASLLVRGRLYRGERGRLYREAAAWLGSGDAESLLA